MNEKSSDIRTKTLRASYLDGVFAASMTGFTQDYFVPFLLFLQGTVRHVGMLNALPNFFAALVQMKSADVTDYLKSRKKIVLIFVFVQALTLLMLTLLSLFIQVTPAMLIFLVVLFCSSAA